jgi:outer membrane protein with beta-barrel domain
MTLNRLLLASATALALVAVTHRAAGGQIYGFRSGLASSSILGGYRDGLASDTRLGFTVSAFYRFALGDLFSIQPELGWTSKGDKGELSLTYVPPTGPPTPVTIGNSFEQRIDYLEIPVLLRIAAPNGSLFEPYLLAGPQVGFRTGSGLEMEIDAGTFDDPHYRDVDWSMIAGGGLAFGRAPFRIVVDARYAYGLTGTFANADASIAHNGSWLTTLGIELR